jgi:hypothetical protein
MGPIGFLETPVNIYRPMLPKSQEQRRSNNGVVASSFTRSDPWPFLLVVHVTRISYSENTRTGEHLKGRIHDVVSSKNLEM